MIRAVGAKHVLEPSDSTGMPQPPITTMAAPVNRPTFCWKMKKQMIE